MKYTGPIYRPPYEANTLLLQVTVGCAHNKCTFCSMYREVKFSTERIEQVEEDLQEAQMRYPNTRRIFLVNGDAFVLSAKRLKPIAELVHKYLPKVSVITMYASINNIKGKTDEELAELKKLGIDELWIGAETGHAATLDYHKKGFTLEDSYEQLERLNKSGIRFYFGFMFGAAGKGKGIENAVATAKIINTVKPLGIVPTTLGAFGETELALDVEKGIFEPATEAEVLEEQKKLIELVEVETFYMGIHSLNPVSFDAKLPEQKVAIIQKIDDMINRMDRSILESVQKRRSV